MMYHTTTVHVPVLTALLHALLAFCVLLLTAGSAQGEEGVLEVTIEQNVKQCFYVKDERGREIFWGYQQPFKLPLTPGTYVVGVVARIESTPSENETEVVVRTGTENVVPIGDEANTEAKLHVLKKQDIYSDDSNVDMIFEFYANDISIELCKVSGPGFKSAISLSSGGSMVLEAGEYLVRVSALGKEPKEETVIAYDNGKFARRFFELEDARFPLKGGIYSEGQLENGWIKRPNQSLLLTFANEEFDELGTEINLALNDPQGSRIGFEKPLKGGDLKSYYLLKNVPAKQGNYYYVASWAKVEGVESEFPIQEASIEFVKTLEVEEATRDGVTLNWRKLGGDYWYQVEVYDKASFDKGDTYLAQGSQSRGIDGEHMSVPLEDGNYLACVIVTNWVIGGEDALEGSQPEASRTCIPFSIPDLQNIASSENSPSQPATPGPVDGTSPDSALDDARPGPTGGEAKPEPMTPINP